MRPKSLSLWDAKLVSQRIINLYAYALEVHCLGKHFDFLGQIANAQRAVVTGAVDAPVVVELGDRLLHPDTAVGITDVQDVAGDDLCNGINQLEGLFCTHLCQI